MQDPTLHNLGYQGQTVLHPLGLTALLVLGGALLVVRRRHALVPIALLTTLIPMAQRISVFTLDWSFARLIVLVGFVRVVLRGELGKIRWTPMDSAVVLWAASGIVLHSIDQGTFSAVVFKTGRAFEFAGMYFLVRALVRSWDDVVPFVRVMIFVAMFVAVFFLIEKRTGRNLFSVFGGVAEVTAIRGGKLRCQGPFAHPIVAGAFWSVILPLIVLHAIERPRERLTAVGGIFGALIVVYACASSTPIMCVLAAIGAAALYKQREHLRLLRWSGVATLIALHFVMKAPVWSLIGRIDLVGGSTGYHRFRLIDQAIHRFSEWAPLGVLSTAHWGWGLHDITNTYLIVGTGGGVLTLVFFIVILGRGFGVSGRLIRRARTALERRRGWCMGTILFVHCVCMLVLGYFGQMDTILYVQLGIVGSLGAAQARSPARRRSRSPRAIPRAETPRPAWSGAEG